MVSGNVIKEIFLEDGTRLKSVPVGSGRAWIDSKNLNYYRIDLQNRKAVRVTDNQ